MDERLNVRLALTMFVAERNKFRGATMADAVNEQVNALEAVVFGRHGQPDGGDADAAGAVTLPVRGAPPAGRASPAGDPRVKPGDDGSLKAGDDGNSKAGGDAGAKDGKAGPKG